MVSKIFEFGKAGGIAVNIRRPHVCGNDTKNISESHLVINDLVVEVSSRKAVQILVSPSNSSVSIVIEE